MFSGIKRTIVEAIEEEREQVFKVRREKRLKDAEEAKKKAGPGPINPTPTHDDPNDGETRSSVSELELN